MQSFAAKIEQVNHIFATYSRNHGFTFVQTNAVIRATCGTQPQCSLFEPDRLHPNREGYSMLSKILRASK